MIRMQCTIVQETEFVRLWQFNKRVIESQGGVSAERAASWKWKGVITIETANLTRKKNGGKLFCYFYKSLH